VVVLKTAWGAETSPGGNSAPAVTNEAGASAVTATTARLNGEVTTTGGESPDAMFIGVRRTAA
jgi:hypothetical protein